MMEHELYDVAQHTQPSNATRGPPRHVATRAPEIQLQLLFNNSHIRIEASQCNSYSSLFFPLPYSYSASPFFPDLIYTYRTEPLPSLLIELFYRKILPTRVEQFQQCDNLARSIFTASGYAQRSYAGQLCILNPSCLEELSLFRFLQPCWPTYNS